MPVQGAGAPVKRASGTGSWVSFLCPATKQVQQELFVELGGTIFSVGDQYPGQSFFQLSVTIAKDRQKINGREGWVVARTSETLPQVTV